MAIEVNQDGLLDLVTEQNETLRDIAVSLKAANIMSLASVMGVDPCVPLDRAKVLRHLAGIESAA